MIVPAPSLQVVDVTGSGEIVARIFLAFIALNHSAERSLVAAIAVASQSITKEGIEHMLNP